ncbi:MAG TPA: arylesterase [Chitinophagaceae bacterium]|nr:arylesterase [Chitinophagaceae bacterium]
MKKISIYLILLAMFSGLSCGAPDKEKAAGKVEEKQPDKSKKKSIIFFGDSLTAGYGLEDPSLAFPALVQKKLDSMGLNYLAVNAGVSGETSAGGLGRIDWILKQPVDIFVLELGANDGLRGISPEETQKNLQGIIDRVKAVNPSAKIIIAGMQVPPSMGQRYVKQFSAIFPKLAKDNNGILIPFLLEGVGGEPELNQADGIHPTPEGHKIVASTVWKYLEQRVR